MLYVQRLGPHCIGPGSVLSCGPLLNGIPSLSPPFPVHCSAVLSEINIFKKKKNNFIGGATVLVIQLVFFLRGKYTDVNLGDVSSDQIHPTCLITPICRGAKLRDCLDYQRENLPLQPMLIIQ